MKENKRSKVILKEETLSQITLEDLLDLGTKAQVAVITLSDNLMKFDNDKLRRLAAEVNRGVGDLCDQIKGAIINSGDKNTAPNQLYVPGERPSRHGDNKMIESRKKKLKNLVSFLLEAIEDESSDEDVSDDSSVTPVAKDEAPTEKNTIDLSAPFKNVVDGLNDDQFQTFKKEVVDVLKGAGITDPAFQTLVLDVEGCANVDDFNYTLDDVYDYADENNVEITTSVEPEEGDSKDDKDKTE